MPYKSKKQRAFMHIHHPEIAKRWDKETGGKVIAPKKVYGMGSPVAHKGMTLDPTGYINREVNKGKRTKTSTRRAGLARQAIQRAASRRASSLRKPTGPLKGLY